ncbi:MAG: TonB-dependent receptor [Deltaproteobacteria bacterium]|nr:MAG: TonB-dependent receptor [Deltaproteobacteria bacterium]
MVMLFFCTTAVCAENALDAETVMSLAPMTVTAEKRKEDVQDVPSSISAFSDTDIKDAHITTIHDLSNVVPNLYIANWGIRGTSYVFVRGIGAVNNEPAVGFYMDDVSLMDPRAFDSNLFDIERIEVLRGPQSTLYGRNSLAGVIHIVTKKPDNETRAGVTYTAGNYNLHTGDIYARTSIIDNQLFLGISAQKASRDGYTDNTYLDRDVDDNASLKGRLNLRWIPWDNLDVSLLIDGETVDDGAFPLGNLYSLQKTPHKIAYDQEGDYERDVSGMSLRAEYHAPGFRLTSISAFRNYKDAASNDQDFSIYPRFTAKEDLEDDQFTQELRVASNDTDADLKWLIGLYGFHKDKTHFLNLKLLPGVLLPRDNVDQNTDSDLSIFGGAVFGQATYTFFDQLSLTAGLRYDYEKSDLDHRMVMASGSGMEFMRSAIDESGKSHAWLPKIQAAYHWNTDVMTYLGVSRGYRSGGFNTAYLDPSDMTFDSEFSWNYEAGMKSSWFKNHLNFNMACFYIDIKDQQIVQLLPTADTLTKNAGRSRSIGFEVETRALLFNGLTLESGFGFADSTFKDNKDLLAGTDYADNETPVSPEYTYNLALQYNKKVSDNWDIFVRTELNGIGPFFWDDANTLKQSSYQLANMNIGLESEILDIVLWARNLFDENYQAVAFAFPGSDPVGQSGDPLTMGITVRARFF